MSGDDEGPKTAAEAEAIAGAAVNFRGTYGGSSGRAAQNYQYIQEQQDQRERQQQDQIGQRQQQQQRQDIQQAEEFSDRDYASRSFAVAQDRPGYTRESDLGDSETQRRIAAGEDAGAVLESQRQAALLTPGTRDDQYYSGELQKWAQNKVEASSAFHHLTKDEGATDVKENPYELQGDLAVEMLKGSPNKRSEFFSPVSGRMNQYLPNDKGLQENSWDAARTGKPQPGSYRDAIDVINRSKGGLVTGTMGTPDRTPLNSPVDSIGGRNLPAPFKSTITTTRSEIIQPTGELPFLGVVPLISPALAMFQPTTKKTVSSTPFVENLPIGSMYSRRDDGGYGAAYTRGFVDDKGKLSDTWTRNAGAPVLGEKRAVGNPTVTTRYNELTGETETITEQAYEQTVSQPTETLTLPTKAGGTKEVTTLESGKSAFDNLNQSVRDTLRLPSPEQGERIMQGASLLNPFTTAQTTASLLTERFNPEAAGDVKAIGDLTGTRGQYTQFYEQPLLMPASYALGAGAGGIWSGVKSGSQLLRATTAERVISQGGMWRLGERGGSAVMRYAPLALTGVYGVSVAERSTEGFTDFTPSGVITKSKSLVIQEGVPGAMGFKAGESFLPNTVKTVKLTRLDYLGMKQEAKAQNLANIPTYGRAGLGEIKYNFGDYALYKTGKFTAESTARASMFGEAAMNRAVEFRVMTKPRAQIAATNTLAGLYGRYYETMGYGSYSPKPSPVTVKGTPKVGINPKTLPESSFAGRISKKVVGGRQVSGLAPERSLKSMGITDTFTTGGGKSEPSFAKGHSTDYRNTPRGSMKPMDTKQSAILFPQEQVRAPDQMFMPRQRSTGLDLMSKTVQPQFEDVAPAFGVRPMFGIMTGQRQPTRGVQEIMQRSGSMSVSRSAQSQQFDQVTQSRFGTRSITPSFLTGRDAVQKSRTDQMVGLTLLTGSVQTRSPFGDTTQRTKTSQKITQRQVPWTETVRTTEETPRIPGGMLFPGAGGSSGDRPYAPRGEYGWSNTNPVADFGYLSQDPFSGKGSKSKSKGPHAKCRHTTLKAKLKCSRYWRNG